MINFEILDNTIEKYAQEQMFYCDLPSIAVSVGILDCKSELDSDLMRGKHLDISDSFKYNNVFGYSDYPSKVPVCTKNVYHAASVTKLLTGTAVMHLVEQGRLHLDDRLVDLFPELENRNGKYNDITLKSMLCHTSGIGDVRDYHWDRPRLDQNALLDYVCSEEVENIPMLWRPAENRFSYSNIAYEMLGAVVAHVSGMDFEEYIRQTILEPLGMKNSTLLTFERTCGNMSMDSIRQSKLVMPHEKDEENNIRVCPYFPYNRQHGPSSTLTTDINDMAKLAEGFLWGDLLTADTYREVLRPKIEIPNGREKMGLTWFIRKQRGQTFYGHEGSDEGFRSSFWICPDKKMYACVMTNISGGKTKKIVKGVIELMLDALEI